jgi:glycosyltransferase involved in cell wall biosynthesis
MPCFNDGATIEEAIESALPPNQEECELVVVDDGSSEPTTLGILESLEQRGIRVIHQSNQGAEVARMNALLETSAPYVFPLDADDALVPGALTLLADALDADPDAVAAWGNGISFGDINMVHRPHREIDPWLLSYVNVLPGSSVFRRSKLIEVGGWTKKQEPGHEDWDLWMGFAERNYAGIYLPIPMLRYRVHGQRRARRAMKNIEAVFAEMERRHPLLFERRSENKRLSSAPFRLKIGMPLINRLGFLPARVRLALRNLLVDPVEVLRQAVGLRLASAKRRLRGGRPDQS